jgi:hypothetical protein
MLGKHCISQLHPSLYFQTFDLFCFIWWDWGLNLGFMFAKQVLYHLIHTSSPFCSGYFWRWGFTNLPGLPQTEILQSQPTK